MKNYINHKLLITRLFLCFALMFVIASCSKNSFEADFNNINNRVWIGEKFWAVPLEDWSIKDKRIECVGNRENMRLNLLTASFNESGNASISLQMGLLKKGETESKAGISIGLEDETDNSIKSLSYFGFGTKVGISTNNFIFIGQSRKELPADFNYDDFKLSVAIDSKRDKSLIELTLIDLNGTEINLNKTMEENLRGSLAIFNNQAEANKNPCLFWFDNLSVSGSLLKINEQDKFGPVLWTMHTLSRDIMKMAVQMPPIGKSDAQEVQLEIKKDGKWELIDNEIIDTYSYVATFRIEGWDSSKDHEYRIAYDKVYENSLNETSYYTGTIRRDPIEKDLKMGALTCQYSSGFPYSPLVKNLVTQDPDILYFSGDQIYEANGGYGFIRAPEGKAILNYLGKWYMFGWAFGDLMRDRPTICTPDDHEFFQGNIWGNGGKKVSLDEWGKNTDGVSGFVQTPRFANVVMQTNCSHLPDPFDPTPMKQGIKVYYTDLVYGKVSFAIVGDRLFKSGPEQVKTPELKDNYYRGNRLDLLVNPVEDMSLLEKPDLQLLGERQMKFLNHWVEDWKGADMKVLLSQTLFANNTTHYGSTKTVLFADLDSGGWPKTARDEVIKTIRKCAAFHICGDQHLPSLIQYGINDFRDAGWAYCTPAISVIYQRRFLPDTLGWEISNRPDHNLPNTGFYIDAFGNPNYIYNVGNPEHDLIGLNRYKRAHHSAAGYGMVNFDKENRDIEVSAYRFMADDSKEPGDNQFPGWPKTINQLENLGRNGNISLPAIKLVGIENPVVKVYDENTNELVLCVRMHKSLYAPKVVKKGTYKITVGDSEKENWQTVAGIKTISDNSQANITIDFSDENK